MELYNIAKNIYGLDVEDELIEAISITRSNLNTLTEERTCKIYSSYLLEELHKRHIPARIVNTIDLGFNYEHQFILVSSNEASYFLSDLTFSQFNSNNFNQLLTRGYQPMNDNEFNYYLGIITNELIVNQVSIDSAFFETKKHR